MQKKYELQDITLEMGTHLIKEFMRLFRVNNTMLCALVTKDVLVCVLKEFSEVMESFQPTKTQIEILENIDQKEKCILIKFNQDPLQMTIDELSTMTENKFAYGLFAKDFYFVEKDLKVHSLNLKDQEGTKGYMHFHSLFYNDKNEAITKDLEFILSYTGHAPQEKNKFAYNIAGNFVLQKGVDCFDLHTGQGLEPTGLCKLFFNALNVSPLFYFTKPNTDFWGRENADLSYWPNLFPVTTNTLKPSQPYRAKQILLLLCQELAKHATPLQLEALVKELKEESNDSISKLCEPRGINWFFKSCANTYTYSSYETQLLKLFSKNIGTPFIKKLAKSYLPECPQLLPEIYSLIASKLDKTEYSSLSCVNRDFSEMKDEMDESRLIWGRKF